MGTRLSSRTVGLGTLLGPEGTDGNVYTSDRPAGACAPRSSGAVAAEWDRSPSDDPDVFGHIGHAASRDLDSRPYLENCTVDASIKYFVAKLIRAHGGCLGTRSR